MNIIGHQKIFDFLEKSLQRKIIFGAYIFAGPEHLGEFHLALQFAKEFAGGGGKKINPDIIVIAPEEEGKKGVCKKKDIKVGQIREMEHRLSLSAYFGRHRIVIIDDADRLTVSAQNALLKTLEEPPKNTAIILIAHNLEKILTTVKSRCVIKKFTLAGKKQIISMLSENTENAEAVFWSLGRPGRAEKLAKNSDELIGLRKEAAEFMNIFKLSLSEKFFLAENLSKNIAELFILFDLWTAILRENIFSRNNNCSVNLPITAAKAFRLIEEIEKTSVLLKETNSNAKVVLENLFIKF